MVEEEDQFTHTVPLIDEEKKLTGEEILNVFKFDPDYEQSESKYQDIKKSLLGDSDSDGDGSDDKGKESYAQNMCTLAAVQGAVHKTRRHFLIIFVPPLSY